MGYAVSFDGWDFETNGVHVDTLDMEFEEANSPSKSAVADRSVSGPGSMSGLRIVLGCRINGAAGDPADLFAKYSTLIQRTNGVDRLKKGRLVVYQGRHFWAQRIGTTRFSIQQGSPAGTFSLTFYSDEPYSRGDSELSVSETTSTTDPNVSMDYNVHFFGNVKRIPIVITSALPWVAGEVIRIRNAVADWRFEKVITKTILGGQNLVLDGELHEVLENGESSPSGIAGTFPYLVGGVSNVLDFSGSDRHGLVVVSLFDRFQG